jgi:hypothetical protein
MFFADSHYNQFESRVSTCPSNVHVRPSACGRRRTAPTGMRRRYETVVDLEIQTLNSAYKIYFRFKIVKSVSIRSRDGRSVEIDFMDTHTSVRLRSDSMRAILSDLTKCKGLENRSVHWLSDSIGRLSYFRFLNSV